MRLYHGSPKRLKILVPKQTKGIGGFENKKAVFLCKTFNHAALYAIGKNLKGKTIFVIIPNKLIIIGNKKPKAGYVYEVEIDAKKGINQQHSYNKQIRNFKIKKVYPKDYKNKIIYVKNKEELMKYIK